MAVAEAGTETRFAAYLPRIATAWAVERPAATWQAIDGTLVFVDVSGFTALSERLAKRGAIGAEELTDVISNSFTELLGVAYAEGGSLLKFGGDALLLMFDGDEHTERACHAALRMRTTMRRVGRLTTTVGNVRLRMSVGIHTGELHLFRVGKSHKELIVCGPATSETVTMEGTAEAGEILVSAAVVAAVPPSLVGAAKGPGWLLRDRRITAVEESYPAVVDLGSEASAAVPVALREHLNTGAVESEHRHATIAFLHYDGTDEFLRREGADAVAAALDELVCDVQRACEDHGVTFLASDLDHDGGKIILVAGVPRALGDDEGRMLRAVRQIADGDRRLRLRIGVNRGAIFAGEVGPSFRRTYTVMGDAVNLAARLMAKAEPEQVLVSEGVLARSRTAFETTTLAPFMVKGKARPVQAFALGAAGGIQEVRQSARLPFVGREHELSVLEEAWAAAATGGGCVVRIVGDAGVGKTRLLQELRARATESAGAEVRVVQCEQYESATPFFAVRVLLRALLSPAPDADPADALAEAVRSLEPSALPWLPLIGDVVGVEVAESDRTAALAPRFRRQRTNLVVVQLLRAALQHPAMLVFEDTHWIDDASREVLGRLAAAAPVMPWLLCLTDRTEVAEAAASPAIGTPLPLGPLSDAETAAIIVQATRDRPLPPHRRAEIVARAGGNPLFVEELLRAVADGSTSDDDVLPDTIEAVLASSVDALPGAERRLLRYSSVLGSTFELSLLERVASALLDIDVPATVLRLEEHLVIEHDGRLRFRHRLLRDVAYRTLPFRRRQDLHRRAAHAIEQEAPDTVAVERAAVLSLHFHEAQEWPDAWAYGRAAGDAAAAKYANVEAVAAYRRALDAARRLRDVDDKELAATWRALGIASNFAGLFEQATAAFREAARLEADDPVALAELYERRAGLAERTGSRLAAVRWIGRGLRHLQAVDTPAAAEVRAELLLHYAWSRKSAGRALEALRWCREAVAAAEASGNKRALAQAYGLLDATHIELGSPELAVHAEKAIALCDELEHEHEKAVLLNNLGAAAYVRGQWSLALSLYQQACAAFDRVGDVLFAAVGSCNVAEIFADQGHLEQAEAVLREVVDNSRSLQVPYVEALATRHLGRISLRQGRTEEALALLDKARATFVAVGVAPKVLEIDVLVAEARLRNAEVEEAVSLLTGALSQAESTGGTELVPTIRRLLGYAAAAQGRLLDAWAELDASLGTARKLGAQFDVALSLEAMSIVAELGGPATDAAGDAERAQILEALSVDAPAPPPISGGAGTPSSRG